MKRLTAPSCILDKIGQPFIKIPRHLQITSNEGYPILSRFFVTLTLSLNLLLPSSVEAFSVRIIFAEQAQGINGPTVTLKVSPGQGLNINFIPTGETIKKAWIDDPSRIALSFDGNLCQRSGSDQQECTNEGATVIHLRQIKPIDFPNLPRSSTGSTLLTLVGEGTDGRRLYQFKVVPTSSEPEYTSITIKPDSEKPTPVWNRVPNVTISSQWQPQAQATNRQSNSALAGVQPSTTPSWVQDSATAPTPKQSATSVNLPLNVSTQEPTGSSPDSASSRQENSSASACSRPSSSKLEQTVAAASSSSTPAANCSEQAIKDANAAALGLAFAKRQGHINPNTAIWKKAQSAIIWLRRGKCTLEAASQARVPVSVLAQLIEWGQRKP